MKPVSEQRKAKVVKRGVADLCRKWYSNNQRHRGSVPPSGWRETLLITQCNQLKTSNRPWQFHLPSGSFNSPNVSTAFRCFNSLVYRSLMLNFVPVGHRSPCGQEPVKYKQNKEPIKQTPALFLFLLTNQRHRNVSALSGRLTRKHQQEHWGQHQSGFSQTQHDHHRRYTYQLMMYTMSSVWVKKTGN